MAFPPQYGPADRVSGLRLAALPNAVSCARRHTRHQLREWHLAEFADDFELAVSEIITNSVKAVGTLTVPASYTAMYDQPPATVLLRLRLTDSCVYAEVWDSSEGLPAIAEAAALDEGGRGLGLVAAVTDDWGFYPSQAGGKVTWCGAKVQSQLSTLRPTSEHDRDPTARINWPMQIDDVPGQAGTPDPYTPSYRRAAHRSSHGAEPPTTPVRARQLRP